MILKIKMRMVVRVLLSLLLIMPLRIYSQNVSDQLLAGKALMDAGRYDEAVNSLTDALKIKQDGRIYEMRAEVLLRSNNYQKAISDFQQANNMIQGIGEYGLARISSMTGKTDEALRHLEKNINSPFRKSEKDIMLDPAFGIIENTPAWRQFWKEERYSMFDRKIPEIEYSLSTGNNTEALNTYKELAADYPGDNQTKYALALIEYSNKKYAEAASLLAEITADERSNEKYLRLLARVQQASGNSAGASSTYSRLMNLEVIDAELYIRRAECYVNTDEIQKARNDITKYLELYPENREALSLAGKIEIRSGDNLKAIDYYSQNLKLHPGDPVCYVDRANAYMSARSWEFAANDYAMALDIDPSDPDVWLNRGVALLNMGKVEDACYDLKKSLSLGNRKASQYISKNCIK